MQRRQQAIFTASKGTMPFSPATVEMRLVHHSWCAFCFACAIAYIYELVDAFRQTPDIKIKQLK